MFLIFPSILARRKICLGICAWEVCLQRLLSDLGHGFIVVNRSAKLTGQTINSTILSIFLRINRSRYLGEGRWISFVLRNDVGSGSVYLFLAIPTRDTRQTQKRSTRGTSREEGAFDQQRRRPTFKTSRLYNKSTHVYTHTIPFTLTVTMFSLSFFVQFRPP